MNPARAVLSALLTLALAFQVANGSPLAQTNPGNDQGGNGQGDGNGNGNGNQPGGPPGHAKPPGRLIQQRPCSNSARLQQFFEVGSRLTVLIRSSGTTWCSSDDDDDDDDNY
jgi:hypothetical protein